MAGVIGMGTYALDTYQIRPNKLEKKLDEILKVQKESALGQRYTTEVLSSRYPLGYAIFSLSQDDNIVFFKNHSSVGDFVFDWSKVRYLENTPNTFLLQMPDISTKPSNIPHSVLHMHGTELGGNKAIGTHFHFYTDQSYDISLEILDADDNGVVFLIGFARS